MLGNEWVLDSTSVTYYWEHPYYPQYLIPLADIRTQALPDTALKTIDDLHVDRRLVGWDAVDRWFEEDEEVFVHPRSPYSRADAIRSNRRVRECPYKGTTSQYWSALADGETTADIAWSYDFPTPALAPIAGLVAFYDEKLQVTVG